jgi:hypothetical protein
MPAFDPAQTQALSRAFDMAWDIIMRTGDLPDTESTRRLLAKRILRLAKAGRTDERRLATAAVMYLRTQHLSGAPGGAPARVWQDTRLRDWHGVDRRPVSDANPSSALPEKIPKYVVDTTRD